MLQDARAHYFISRGIIKIVFGPFLLLRFVFSRILLAKLFKTATLWIVPYRQRVQRRKQKLDQLLTEF